MELSGASADLEAGEVKMRQQLETDGLVVRPFERANVPVYATLMYPYALAIEATAPATKGSDFLADLTQFLGSKGVNITSYLQELFEPALAVHEHALASLHILTIAVPLDVIVHRAEFEEELRKRATKHGCIELRCGEPRGRRVNQGSLC